MENIDNIMQLCRLCLVKEQVNVPIFGQNNDIEEISAKISSCLPVKVSLDDSLPKKICDDCSYKLNLLYVFRNTSINSEKQLYQWLEQAGISKVVAAAAAITTAASTTSLTTQSSVNTTVPSAAPTSILDNLNDTITKSEISVKQEKSDSTAGSELSAETQEYLIQQQKLPYQESFGDFNTETNSADTEEPARKKPRRAAASKPPIKDNESDSDLPPKAEDDSEEEEEEDIDDIGDGGMDEEDDDEDEEEEDDGLDHPEFVDVPSTSAEEQPGPSGVNKDPIAAPGFTRVKIENDVCIIEEIGLQIIIEDDDEDEDTSSDVPSKKKDTLCERCGNKYGPNYLCKHRVKVHEKHYVLCHHCGDFVRKEGFTTHEKIHGICCEICPAVFKTIDELSEHQKTHNDRIYECDKCPLTFTTPFQLVLHNREHNGLSTLQCCKCQFSTKKLAAMKEHLRRHEDRYNHVCDVCKKRFYKRIQLNAHKQIHQAIPQFVCEFCDKKFVSQRYLNNHRMFNHSKELTGIETTYKCKVCGRCFKFEVSLKRHLSTIHNIGECRKVPCPVCSKVIANPYNLKMHMRTHTGEKLYVCDLCGLRLSSLKNWKKHVKSQHPNNVVE